MVTRWIVSLAVASVAAIGLASTASAAGAGWEGGYFGPLFGVANGGAAYSFATYGYYNTAPG